MGVDRKRSDIISDKILDLCDGEGRRDALAALGLSLSYVSVGLINKDVKKEKVFEMINGLPVIINATIEDIIKEQS